MRYDEETQLKGDAACGKQRSGGYFRVLASNLGHFYTRAFFHTQNCLALCVWYVWPSVRAVFETKSGPVNRSVAHPKSLVWGFACSGAVHCMCGSYLLPAPPGFVIGSFVM